MNQIFWLISENALFVRTLSKHQKIDQSKHYHKVLIRIKSAINEILIFHENKSL